VQKSENGANLFGFCEGMRVFYAVLGHLTSIKSTPCFKSLSLLFPLTAFPIPGPYRSSFPPNDHHYIDNFLISLHIINVRFYVHRGAMDTINVTNARKNLYQLLDKIVESHEPVQITGKNGSAVLISEEDWKSVQETLYLLSIPGMRESIREGLAEPIGRSTDRIEL
jgi:antitoxin YefM